MGEFKKLGLSDNLVRLLEKLKFKAPTEIQAKSIPAILEGKDVIGYSATGSGKTFAFGAGIVEKAKKGLGVQALILTPTRELAEQVGDQFILFSKGRGSVVSKVYGGVSILPQIDHIRMSEIVIGTPGRLLDHLQRETLDLSKVKTLILDEADRLVDMGFLPDVEKIISLCPKKRQTLLFSATSSRDVDYIQETYMENPLVVEVIKYVDASKLKQIYYDVPANLKFSLLVHLLKKDSTDLAMVFCNTKINADIVARNLKDNGINALPIHGGLAQNKRSNILKKFHDRDLQVLVCTDVAARGLDIKNVSHVYNYDSPKNNKEYIHRIGRTARAGKEGKAVSLVSDRDYENFRRVVEDSSLKIEPVDVPKLERVSFQFKRYERNSGRRFEGNNRGYNRSYNRSYNSRGNANGSRRYSGRSSRNEGYSSREGSSRYNREGSSRGSSRYSRESSSRNNSLGDRSRNSYRSNSSEGNFRSKRNFGNKKFNSHSRRSLKDNKKRSSSNSFR